MGYRSLEEILRFSAEPECQRDENRYVYDLKPATMNDETVAFMIAASEDDLDDDDWVAAFELCEGRSNAEIAHIMWELTTDDHKKATPSEDAEMP